MKIVIKFSLISYLVKLETDCVIEILTIDCILPGVTELPGKSPLEESLLEITEVGKNSTE